MRPPVTSLLTPVAVLVLWVSVAQAQTPVVPPPLPAEREQQLKSLPPEGEIYERFRYWAGFQPPEVQREALKHYDAYLATLGVPPAERATRIKIIESQGERQEVERWNRILTAEKPTFNTEPNAFLVEMVKDALPARRWMLAWAKAGTPSTSRNKDGPSLGSILLTGQSRKRMQPPRSWV